MRKTNLKKTSKPKLLPLQSYSKTTRDVEIQVFPEFLAEQSNPEQGFYSYAYTVRMRNLGPTAIQLINRHWRVYSGMRQVADIKGEGVIGEQPVLDSGSEYKYTSWTTVTDPIGAMQGAYTFYSERGEFFDVEVPNFELLYLDASRLH